MARKAQFFTVKRSDSGSDMLILRGKQIASIWQDSVTRKFVCAFASRYHIEEFDSWNDAERYAWLHGLA